MRKGLAERYSRESMEYNSLRPIYNGIATRIVQEIKDKNLSKSELIGKLANSEGILPATAQHYISLFEMGIIHGTTSLMGYVNGEHLERLSKLLGLIGITENDSIITDLREVEPRFEYPATEEFKSLN